jgi:cytochrome b6-f complex iron-sulfur subunit
VSDAELNRRTVLLGAATLAGVGVVVACSPGGDSGGNPGGPQAPGPGGGLAALDDVPVGGAVSATTAAGAAVIISRPTESEVRGFSAICTHRGCTVQPDGAELRCPCHGSVFEAATGRNVEGPAPSPLPEFSVRIDGDQVVEA